MNELELVVDEKFSQPLPVDFVNHEFVVSYSICSTATKVLFVGVNLPIVLYFTCLILGYRDNLYVQGFGLLMNAFLLAIVIAFIKSANPSIRLSSKGISFANAADVAVTLLNRKERTWEDVHSIKLEESEGHNYEPRWFYNEAPSVDKIRWKQDGKPRTTFVMRFDFVSGGHFVVALNNLTRTQCRYLFQAIETWVPPTKLNRDLIKLKHALISETECGSFTEIWMQDLEQRYAITNFAPLVVGHSLVEGKYTIATILSTRGQTAVYLAKERTGKQVVLKEIVSITNGQDQAKEKAREMFQRQAEILIKLHHPQIARVVDCFIQEGRDYLALEYIAGKTLRQLVKTSGPRKVYEVKAWLTELLDILEYLHGCAPPVLHRDLTPDNIVLKTDGTIAVIDFGAANEFLGTATGTLVGKQSYVSPEQFRGKAEPRSDLYSLGATAYFLITGRDPTPLSELKPSAADAQTDPTLDDFVLRCTKFDTTKRFESASDAKEFLNAARLAKA